jgi:cyclic beta-1,2-glucan synthetase
MLGTIRLELVDEKPESQTVTAAEPHLETLRSAARELARSLNWLPTVRSSDFFPERARRLAAKLGPVLRRLNAPLNHAANHAAVSEELQSLRGNRTLLTGELQRFGGGPRPAHGIPHVQTVGGKVVPRVFAVAKGLLLATDYQFSEQAFIAYVEGFQENTSLEMQELWLLISAIKLILLEEVAARATRVLANVSGSHKVDVCLRSLREASQTSWKEIIEPLILLDRVLRKDPAGVYSSMDFESRDLYRAELVNIAQHSDCSEQETALMALSLAEEAHQQPCANPREANRYSHIGYYLASDGIDLLRQKVGFRAPFGQQVRTFLKKHPDEFYLPAIAVLTLAIMSTILLLLTDPGNSPVLILVAMITLLLPCSQSAVQVVNYLVTSLLKPQVLPKIDLSDGIPDSCITMVAVPTLLLSDNQVRRLVDDLEVRFLGNHDPNLHFALVTDLPDSPAPAPEDDPLITLCESLIRDLNQKYDGRGMGSFFLFHRHRVYNPREGVWMGWERKRGKLLDLNKLLRSQYDSFPVKIGDLSLLPQVRFVITLDADTELPRGSAHRMIGTLAHPLNQAIIDPENNVVVAGYGILQPRVGVSVQSAARSRLAKIYSGETGLDIYTCAVSDVYQDLYGEGTFAGKGIYEVEVLQQVLEGRFPRNALLSHDLIEGAYARAGLVSDIQIIEGYPSHYSAYNRRKHRWLRGDWQIVEWLGPRVHDEMGHQSNNPISLLSFWKILDNLRRSLVEPATFLLLVLGWLVLPGNPRWWTIATVCILFVPAWCRFLFALVRASAERSSATARGALDGLFAANVSVLLALTFLAHQMLLSIDAMIRTLVRRIVTGRRLLQWETAAEAELGTQARTPLDIYLDWTPALALAMGLLVWTVHRSALPAAAPILLLWASSKLVSVWLNLSPTAPRKQVSEKDRLFLRGAALRTWRYFDEFSNQEHNWLIPDNVQGEPLRVAPRLSPTNLGVLLNARQVACSLGYLTVPEFAERTQQTLDTMAKLERYRGHLLNWYDTRTLQALRPRFVSSVDNGNLVASLWTLEQGCLELIRQPILQSSLADGLLDHLRILAEQQVLPRKTFNAVDRAVKRQDWQWALDLRALDLRVLDLPALDLPDSALEHVPAAPQTKSSEDVDWFTEHARARLAGIRQTVRSYTPWLLPEFGPVRGAGTNRQWGNVALEHIPQFIDRFTRGLQAEITSGSEELKELSQQLLDLLPEARRLAVLLIQQLRALAKEARTLADEMDFHFLLHPQRKLLSVGFDVETQQLNAACYDLLASEARTAVFVATAKDDIPQETWFQLGRPHTLQQGRPVLMSWTGTMFEYLMPFIWLRSFPGTMLERSRSAAVRAQRAYTSARRIPWGISESACSTKDDCGNYNYMAFGLPPLALQKGEMNALVISPYSTFLALPVDPVEALKNLHQMNELEWVGAYGFCESADYAFGPRRRWGKRFELVHCWMAHHQGMSLLSLGNFLGDGMVQNWFHREPRVQATELLLQEKPVAYVRPSVEKYGTTAA